MFFVLGKCKQHAVNYDKLTVRKQHLSENAMQTKCDNTFHYWAFSVARPTVWNSLPDDLRDPECSGNIFSR